MNDVQDPAWDRVRAALDALAVPFEPMPCDPAFADTAAFCERYGIAPEESANTILVASRQEPRRWAACLVLSHCRLDVNHAVSRLLGVKRLSFASADETREKTGMMIGGVSLRVAVRRARLHRLPRAGGAAGRHRGR